MVGLARIAVALACASALSASTAASSVALPHPLRFFEGVTESIGVMKRMMHKPYRVRSIGRGTIEPDGSLTLVQDVRDDDGQPPRRRTWRVRQIGVGKYSGSMTDASGPVTIDEIGGAYRFSFKMSGNLAVEQWLIPNRDGQSGASKLTIRMFGMKVASCDGDIRKLAE